MYYQSISTLAIHDALLSDALYRLAFYLVSFFPSRILAAWHCAVMYGLCTALDSLARSLQIMDCRKGPSKRHTPLIRRDGCNAWLDRVLQPVAVSPAIKALRGPVVQSRHIHAFCSKPARNRRRTQDLSALDLGVIGRGICARHRESRPCGMLL